MMNTSTKEEKRPRSSSAELRRALDEAEGRRRVATQMIDDGEIGGAEMFDSADADCRRLTALVMRAAAREAEEDAARNGAARAAASKRLESEAAAWSAERRDAFRDEVVAEAVELEARLDRLYVRIVDVQDACRAARERLAREAQAAGVSAPAIPVWSGFVGEIGSAIFDAHMQRASAARAAAPALSPRVAAVTAGQIPTRAERARRLLEPRRG